MRDVELERVSVWFVEVGSWRGDGGGDGYEGGCYG